MRIVSKFEAERTNVEPQRRDRRRSLFFSLSKKNSTPSKPKGYLVSVDAYMNLQLASTQEFIDGKLAGDLGEVLIRCNNVLYVRGAPDEGGGGGAS